MKRRYSTEPDLFVINQKLTEEDKKQFSFFIAEARKKASLKKVKHKKAA